MDERDFLSNGTSFRYVLLKIQIRVYAMMKEYRCTDLMSSHFIVLLSLKIPKIYAHHLQRQSM